MRWANAPERLLSGSTAYLIVVYDVCTEFRAGYLPLHRGGGSRHGESPAAAATLASLAACDSAAANFFCILRMQDLDVLQPVLRTR